MLAVINFALMSASINIGENPIIPNLDERDKVLDEADLLQSTETGIEQLKEKPSKTESYLESKPR